MRGGFEFGVDDWWVLEIGMGMRGGDWDEGWGC